MMDSKTGQSSDTYFKIPHVRFNRPKVNPLEGPSDLNIEDLWEDLKRAAHAR